MTQEINHEELENFEEAMEPLEGDFLNSSLIQDNKIVFNIGNKVLRVRMPNQYEQTQAEEARNRKQIELLQSGNAVSEKKLVKLLKENDVVDIEDLRKQKDKLSKDLTAVFIALATKHTSEEKTIEILKTKTEQIRQDMRNISVTIAKHLSSSIESQEENVYVETLTALCIEECVGDNAWARKWETIEDFKKEDRSITGPSLSYLTWLILNTRG